MRHETRFAALLLLFALTTACGSPENQSAATPAEAPPAGDPSKGNALTTGGSESAPSQSAQTRTAGSDRPLPAESAAAPSAGRRTVPVPAAPAATSNVMRMDVPSGTELHLILETPVSSETAEPEQTVRARVAKPVIIDGMTVVPEGAPVRGTVVS